MFITAWNPESRALGRRENDRRQAMLAAEVMRLGLASVTGRGQSPDWSWPAEESLLVLGLSKKAGREMGRRFGQFAIVAGRRGGRARLVRCASQPRA